MRSRLKPGHRPPPKYRRRRFPTRRRPFVVSWEPLREKRLAMHISQAELAAAADCHDMTILRIEKGRADPPHSLVLAIARAMGVSMGDLTRITDIAE